MDYWKACPVGKCFSDCESCVHFARDADSDKYGDCTKHSTRPAIFEKGCDQFYCRYCNPPSP